MPVPPHNELPASLSGSSSVLSAACSSVSLIPVLSVTSIAALQENTHLYMLGKETAAPSALTPVRQSPEPGFCHQ